MASMLQSVAEDLVHAAGGNPRAIEFGGPGFEFAVPALLAALAVLAVMLAIRDLAALARIAGCGVVAMIFNVLLLVGSGGEFLFFRTSHSIFTRFYFFHLTNARPLSSFDL